MLPYIAYNLCCLAIYLKPIPLKIEYVRLRSKKPKRSHGSHDNPKKDKPRTQTKYGACFMSEIQLQNLLDRTKGSEEDEGAMDMTLIDGVRMSKFDIRAVKVGKKYQQI